MHTMLPPGGRRPRPHRLAFVAPSWGLLALLAAGLFAFPSNAGQDPYHAHVVVGGTPAEQARALAHHLLGEREGIDDGGPPMAFGAARGVPFPGVHVISIRGGGGGAAVLSIEGSGVAALAAAPHVPAPARARGVVTHDPSRVPQATLPTPEPPPRHRQASTL